MDLVEHARSRSRSRHPTLAPSSLAVRRPTVVELSWPGGSTAPLGPGHGWIVLTLLAPARARAFRLTMLDASFPAGTTSPNAGGGRRDRARSRSRVLRRSPSRTMARSAPAAAASRSMSPVTGSRCDPPAPSDSSTGAPTPGHLVRTGGRRWPPASRRSVRFLACSASTCCELRSPVAPPARSAAAWSRTPAPSAQAR